jgi:gamma-glutamylaminecyclotransferase
LNIERSTLNIERQAELPNLEPRTGNPKPLLIFVYGTLKRGLSNHSYLAGKRFVSEARTRPEYRLFDLGGYPGMVHTAADGLSIEGEIWEIDDACLQGLDRLEDIKGGEYERTFIALAPPFDSEKIEGYVYLRSVAGRRDAGSVW